jgi:hypothetical protein
MTDVSDDGAFVPDAHMEMAMAAMTDLAAPQPAYL